MGVSALRAIFATQSNDFALGLPVMTVTQQGPFRVSLFSPFFSLKTHTRTVVLKAFGLRREAFVGRPDDIRL